jgi:hypothetical protein
VDGEFCDLSDVIGNTAYKWEQGKGLGGYEAIGLPGSNGSAA